MQKIKVSFIGLAMFAGLSASDFPARAATEVVIHNFNITNPSNEGLPFGVIGGGNGDLYGTLAAGGDYFCGLIYRLPPSGREQLVYEFTGGADGCSPQAALVSDAAGNLYGTTATGGSGFGVVFKVDPVGVETVLHTFSGGLDGATPYSSVTLGANGSIYGTTSAGGAAGSGVVFEIDSNGLQTVLHSFNGGADGANPYSGVVLDNAGNLYGTTVNGGSGSVGVVYKTDPQGNEAVLHSFAGRWDGANPYSGLTRDPSGNLYGVTNLGGSASIGVLYKLTPNGHETVLHTFTGPDGAYPQAPVLFDRAGNLYGTAYEGGAADFGVVYKIAAGSHEETVLYSFLGIPDGAYPNQALHLDANGDLYSTTDYGGSAFSGTIFKIVQADGSRH